MVLCKPLIAFKCVFFSFVRSFVVSFFYFIIQYTNDNKFLFEMSVLLFRSFQRQAETTRREKKNNLFNIEIMGSISLRKILSLRYDYHCCRVWQSQNYHIRHALVENTEQFTFICHMR